MTRAVVVLTAWAAISAIPAVAGAQSGTGARAAALRSIPLLQASADTWFEKRKCSSCHHQGVGMIAMGVARERGAALDEGLLARQLQRTIVPAKGWLEGYVLGEVSINEPIGQSYRAVGVGAVGATRTPVTDAIGYLLAGQQHESGAWRSYSHRPPLEDTAFTATAYTIRALQLFPVPGRTREMGDRIARARRWLQVATPRDTEDRVMQLLGLAWAGVDAADLVPMRTALLAEQRADGGWSQLATRGSDAYATGQVLAALSQAAGLPVGDAAYRRGVAFLVRTQHADGSWRVETRRTWRDGLEHFESGYPHGKHQFISYAGAAWATMALLLSDRDAHSPALMGRPVPRGPASAPTGEPDGLTSLMRAALYGTLDEMSALLEAGAAVDQRSPRGLTALMCAVHDPAKVRRLLAAGADAGAVTETQHSVLLLAASYSGAAESARLVLAKAVPADVMATAGNLPNQTPLVRALLRGNVDLAGALVRAGARIDGPPGAAVPPIFIPVFQQDAPTVRWMIDRGARLDVKGGDEIVQGATPLMIAAEEGDLSVVRALLDAGADGSLTESHGYTVVDLVDKGVDYGQTGIRDRLVSARAPR